MVSTIIVIIPALTLLLFFLNLFYKGNTVQTCLLFILVCLPLMDLKITKEAWGGFKTFDFVCFYALIFLFKEFIKVSVISRNNLYFLLFILLGIIILFGSLNSEFPDLAYLKLIKLLPIFIFARFFLTEFYKDPSFHWKAVNALKISYLIALGFLLIQRIIGLRFTFYPGLSPNTMDPVFHIVRYPGIFYDSQAHGQYLAMGSFLFFYMEDNISQRKKWFNYGIFLLSIGAIAIAGSRAAFGGFLVGMVISFLMGARSQRFFIAGLFVIGFIGYTLVSVHNGVVDRASNVSEDLQFRQSIWKEAFDISKKHPILGIGTGNYQKYVIRHSQDQYLEIEDGQLVYFDQPENGYLKIMVEFGFIGFAIFALYLIVPMLKGVAMRIRNVYDFRVGFLIASLISWLVAFNTVYSIYDYRILIMVASMVVLIIAYPVNEPVDDELVTQEER